MTVHTSERGSPAGADIRINKPLYTLGTSNLEDFQQLLEKTDQRLTDMLSRHSIMFLTPAPIRLSKNGTTSELTFPGGTAEGSLRIHITHNQTGASFEYRLSGEVTDIYAITNNQVMYAVIQRDGTNKDLSTGNPYPDNILSTTRGTIVIASEIPKVDSNTVWYIPICKRIDPFPYTVPFLYWFFGYGLWLDIRSDFLGAEGSGTTILTAYTVYPKETISDPGTGAVISSSGPKGFHYRPIDFIGNITLSPVPFGDPFNSTSSFPLWEPGTVITVINDSKFYNMNLVDGSTVKYGLDIDRQIIVVPPTGAYSFIYDGTRERWLPLSDLDNAFVKFSRQTVPSTGGHLTINSNTSMQLMPVEGAQTFATGSVWASSPATQSITTDTYAYASYQGVLFRKNVVGPSSTQLAFDGIKTIDQVIAAAGGGITAYGASGATVLSTGVVPFVLYPTVQSPVTPNPGTGSNLYGWSIAATPSGDRVVIGASGETVGANTLTGRVYIFVVNSNMWILEQTLTFPGTPAASTYFGGFGSIAISADGLHIAVPAVVDTAGTGGRVYTYTKVAGTWTWDGATISANGTIASPNALAGGYFGQSVVFDATGSTLVIGAISETVGASTTAGRVYIYKFTNPGWALQQTLYSPNGVATGNFGMAISMTPDASRIAIGAWQETYSVATAGRAYVYRYNATASVEVSPSMLSNTLPAGFIVTTSSARDATESYKGWRAFDNTLPGSGGIGAWNTVDGSTTGWLRLQFPTKIIVNSYSIMDANNGGTGVYNPLSWTIEASNNGLFSNNGGTLNVDYVILDTRTNQSNWKLLEVRNFTLFNGQAHFYYQINVSSNNGGSYLAIGELKLFSTAPGYELEQQLTSLYPIASGNFGCSLSFDNTGSRLAVGAGREAASLPPATYLSGAGRVYIFSRSGTIWSIEQSITSPNLVDNGYFGWFRQASSYGGTSVALSGDGKTLLVGASNENLYAQTGTTSGAPTYTTTRSGRLYTFALSDSTSILPYNLVPFMTSASIPAGNMASASSELSASYPAWNAFQVSNNTDAASWYSSAVPTTIAPQYLQIKLAEAASLYAYQIINSNEATVINASPRNWTIEGSPNGVAGSWVTLDTQINQSFQQAEGHLYTLSVSSSNYLYFRILITANNGNITYVRIGKFRLFGTSSTNSSVSQYIWKLQNSLASPNPIAAGQFGTSNVISSDGSFIVSNAHVESSGGQATGRVYAFKKDAETSSSLKTTLSSPYKISGGRYGRHAAITEDGTRIVVGAFSEPSGSATGANAAGKAYIYLKTAGVWALEQTLYTPNPIGNGNFGCSVAISNDGLRIFVGAYEETASSIGGAGNGYVYFRSGSAWTLEKNLISPNPVSYGRFGTSGAFSADGSRLIVGAYNETGAVSNSGRAYIFLRTGTDWAIESASANLVSGPGLAISSGNYGFSVAIDNAGVLAVVGAYGESNTASASGRVYVYIRTGNVWSIDPLATYLVSPNPINQSGNFGYCVSISGDGTRIAVGASNENNNGNPTSVSAVGRVYVFVKTAGIWTTDIVPIISPNIIASGAFGSTVCLNNNGSLLQIGASSESVNSIATAGRSYLFSRAGTTWSLVESLTSPNLATTGYFGNTSGKTIASNSYVVGGNNEASAGAGAVSTAGNLYVYDLLSPASTTIALANGTLASNISFSAVNLGTSGNSVTFPLTGINLVSEAVSQWNLTPANASNQIINSVGSDALMPISTQITLSSGGNDLVVTFTAVNPGINGELIALVFDGIKTITKVTSDWNNANPSNPVTYIGNGNGIPLACTVKLLNGVATIDSLVFGDPLGSADVAAKGITVPYSSSAYNKKSYNTFSYNSYIDDVGNQPVFFAKTAGNIGDNIKLVFDGIRTIDQVVNEWNINNSGNQVGYINALGTTVLSAGSTTITFQIGKASLVPTTSPALAGAYGVSVSISGDATRVAVGACNETATNVTAGRVYVYILTGDIWELETTLVSPNPPASLGQFGRTLALNSDGSKLVVGATGETYSAALTAGRAYVYFRSGTTWTLSQSLGSPNPLATGNFGGGELGVAISGNGSRIIIGGPGENNLANTKSGNAYLYRLDGSVYTLESSFVTPNPIGGGLFGTVVSLSYDGLYAAVGAFGETNPSTLHTTAGRVYVYTRSGTTWTLQQAFNSPNSIIGGRFGSVSLSGDGYRLAIGGYVEQGINPTSNVSVASSGRAYVYLRAGTTWTLESSFSSPNTTTAISGSYGLYVRLNYNGSHLLVSAHNETYINTGAGRAYRYTRVKRAWVLTDVLTGVNPVASSYFGYGACISDDGSYSAIGAYNETTAAAGAGKVYIFGATTKNFNQQQQLFSPNAATGSNFGRGISYSEDGTRVVIGASQELVGTNGGAGRVYVYGIYGGEWKLEQAIVSPNVILSGYFGTKTALSYNASTLVIGAQGESAVSAGGNSTGGRAYVYSLTTAGTFLDSLVSTDVPLGSGYFGKSVSISGDGLYAVVGAPFENTTMGRVYFFVKSGATWVACSSPSVTSLNPIANGTFGNSVSISSDGLYVLVGASGENGGSAGSGRAYTYIRSGIGTAATWTNQGSLVSPNAAANPSSFFGVSVSISADGSYALVGASKENAGQASSGRAYVFLRTLAAWGAAQTSYLVSPNITSSGEFGNSVSISADGSYALVGAWGEAIGSTFQAGKVYVFLRSGATWSIPQATLFSTMPTLGANFGNAVSISGDGSYVVIASMSDAKIYVYKRSGTTWSSLSPIIGISGIGFGYSVSLSFDGAYVIVGAIYFNSTSGRAYVYQSIGGNPYSLIYTFNSPNPSGNGHFGFSVNISSDGGTAIIGADQELLSAVSTGRAYICAIRSLYRLDQQLVSTPIANSVTGGLFGSAIAISGDSQRIFIGAQAENVPGFSSAGRAYVYKYNTGTKVWDLETAIIPSAPINSGSFSVAGALSYNGTVLAIGAYKETIFGATNTSLIYNMTSNTAPAGYIASASSAFSATFEAYRCFDGRLENENTWYSSQYPGSAYWVLPQWISLQLPSAKIVVGYSLNMKITPFNLHSGAKDYRLQGSNDAANWTDLHVVTNDLSWTDGVAKVYNVSRPFPFLYYRILLESLADPSGYYFAIRELILYVGTPANTGAAYIYSFNGSSWILDEAIGSPNPVSSGFFGQSVSLSGDTDLLGSGNTLAIGAYQETLTNSGLTAPGRVYIYNRSGGISTLSSKILSPNLQSNGQFGNTVTLSRDGRRLLTGAHGENYSSAITSVGKGYLFQLLFNKWRLEYQFNDNIYGSTTSNGYFGMYAAMAQNGLALLLSGYNIGTSGRAYSFLSSSLPKIATASFTPNLTSLVSSLYGISCAMSGDGTKVIIGAYQDTANGITTAGRVYIYSIDSNDNWTLEQILASPFAMTGGSYGYCVSITDDGSVVIVGAPFEAAGATNAGRAYLYRKINSIWVLEQAFMSPNGIINGYFSSTGDSKGVYLSGDGTRLAIGAQGEKTGTYDTGTVYVYLRAVQGTGYVWSLEQTINSSGLSATVGNFGTSLSMTVDGTRLLVGASGEGTSASGLCHLYLRTGNTWALERSFSSFNPVSAGNFCVTTISGDGTRLAIGGRNENAGAATSAGRVYIYVRSGSTWTIESTLVSPNAITNGIFGLTIKMDQTGTNLLVGAYQETVAEIANAGRAYLYTRTGSIWALSQSFTPNFNSSYSALQSGARFGVRVSLNSSATKFIITAYMEQVSGVTSVGRAYYFKAEDFSNPVLVNLTNGKQNYGLTFMANTSGSNGNNIFLNFTGTAAIGWSFLSLVISAWNSANPTNQVSVSPSSPDLMLNTQTIGLTNGLTNQVSTFNASVPGLNGNNIVLSFDGVKTIADILNSWNTSNSSNMATTTTPLTVVIPAQIVNFVGGTSSYPVQRSWNDSLLIELIGFGNGLAIKHLDQDWGQLLDNSESMYIGRGGSGQFILDKDQKRWIETGRTRTKELQKAAYNNPGYVYQSDGWSNSFTPVKNIYVADSTNNINWSTGHTFYKAISTNAVFTFSNQVDGQIINLTIENTSSSNITVTLPTAKWVGGIVRNIITAISTTIFTIERVNNTYFIITVENLK